MGDLQEFTKDELLSLHSEGRCIITDHTHFGEYPLQIVQEGKKFESWLLCLPSSIFQVLCEGTYISFRHQSNHLPQFFFFFFLFEKEEICSCVLVFEFVQFFSMCMGPKLEVMTQKVFSLSKFLTGYYRYLKCLYVNGISE